MGLRLGVLSHFYPSVLSPKSWYSSTKVTLSRLGFRVSGFRGLGFRLSRNKLQLNCHKESPKKASNLIPGLPKPPQKHKT